MNTVDWVFGIMCGCVVLLVIDCADVPAGKMEFEHLEYVPEIVRNYNETDAYYW